MTAAGRTGRVLVVDDHEANRLLVRDLLEPQGYEVLEAVDGTDALAVVTADVPDVVLLDVHMPRMDGFEACRRLKTDPATEAIPVLLVTALAAREHRLQGIRAGANDFITKPIDTTDLTLRVKNAMRMRHLYLEVMSQYRRLQMLEEQRDSLVHMMVHDLRSPLTGLYCALEELQLDLPPGPPSTRELIKESLQLTYSLADMVSDVLDVSRMEAGQMPLSLDRLDLAALAVETVNRHRLGRLVIDVRTPPAGAPVEGDRKILGRVLTNLIDNAVKFSPPGGRVQVVVEADESTSSVAVHDTGSGIPPEALETIFEKFGQVGGANHYRRSSGLGLTFCKFAVEAHGGVIGVESEMGVGSRFWFTLPRPGAAGPGPESAP